MYADALGDERGEHIVLAHLATPTLEQQRRERELRRAAERELLAIMKARLVWRGGFVDRIDVDVREIAKLPALLARPELMRVRAIDLRPYWYLEQVDLATLALPPSVRWLGVGSLYVPLDLAKVPKLRGLALSGPDIDISMLDVTDLEITANFDEATIEAVSRLPLERLVITGSPDTSVLERFAPIFDGKALPALKHFGIGGGDDAFNSAFAERLAKSPLFARLESVGFTARRTDGSNAWLIEHRDQFARVKLFTASPWDGGWIHCCHDLAHLYESLGRRRDALAELEALVTFDDDAAYWADIGMQLAALERRDEALAAHDRALEIDSKNQRAWSGKACVLEDLERFADALVAWDAGLAVGLKDVHTFTHRAWTLMKLDRNADALVALDEALALDPENEWAKTNKANLAPKGIIERARRWIGR